MALPRPLLHLQEKLTTAATRFHDRRRKTGAAAARGHRGEDAAYFFLRRCGFQVVAQRWQTHGLKGEMDLIAWEGETLCFVEVKTRQDASGMAAETAVDATKERAMKQLGQAYVRALPWPDGRPRNIALRYDLVTVHLLDEHRQDIQLTRGMYP